MNNTVNNSIKILADTIDKDIMDQYFTATSTTSIAAQTLPQYTTTTGPLTGYTNPPITSIHMGGGSLKETNGNLTWNGNNILTDRLSISSLMKDALTRDIVLCEDRETCRLKYGEYGLKIFDSMLKDVLTAAINSEEAFNIALKATQVKIELLKNYILENISDPKEKVVKSAEIYKLLGGNFY